MTDYFIASMTKTEANKAVDKPMIDEELHWHRSSLLQLSDVQKHSVPPTPRTSTSRQ